MRYKGKLYSVNFDRQRKPLVTFRLENNIDESELIGKDLAVEVDEWKEKRSRNANSYMWELCNKLAGLGFKTKDEIYRNAVKAVGIYRDFHISPEEVTTFRAAWEMLGTAWITERLDYSTDGNTEIIRAYYGSSVYNTKQMSKLIDYLIQDCTACGITVLSQRELSLLIDDWKPNIRKD